MFNVQVKQGNVRCNGLLPSGTGGMVKRPLIHSAMPPNRGPIQPLSDTKLKFSDRLKAYLHSDDLASETTEVDDPYTFNDGEVINIKPTNNAIVRRVPENRTSKMDAKVKTKVERPKGDRAPKDTIKKVVKVNNLSDVVDGKLQAQIGRNKITVKHNLNADLKQDRNHLDKSTKHSIIGLVNNVNNTKTSHSTRRLPSGKPIPAHLRARRSNSKNTTHHEGSLQRIPQNILPTVSSISKISNLSIKSTSSNSAASAVSTLGNARWHAPQPYGPLAGSRASQLAARLGYHSDSDDEDVVYQKHWFNKEIELLSNEETSREARLEITRQELKRQLHQMKKSKIGSWRSSCSNSSPNLPSSFNSTDSICSYVTALARTLVLERRLRRRQRSPVKVPGIMVSRHCDFVGCAKPALPCTKNCAMHIMNNQDQVLFEHCTAKFADNTQCSVPVFDIMHELPLCIEHARKRDNYNRMCMETKPKKPRRKIKPSAMIRPQKRNKKRKRSTTQKSPDVPHIQTTLTTNHISDVTDLNVCETSSAYESSEEIAINNMSETEFVTIKTEDHIGDQDVVEQVLAMQEEVGGDLELVVEQTLVTQASRLLEETDFTNVLNQIPADEFNDLFAVDRNGEYEPSREETEELERALEAVDEDVKSLEKLSATQGLLDSLLDEHTLVESLVQIPDVFHNGYEVIGSPSSHQNSPRALPSFHPGLHPVDGMLPVQPQAHAPS